MWMHKHRKGVLASGCDFDVIHTSFHEFDVVVVPLVKHSDGGARVYVYCGRGDGL